jgi:hypothetical protein
MNNQLILDLGDTASATGIGPTINAFMMQDLTYTLGNAWQSVWDEATGTGALQNMEQLLASAGAPWIAGQSRFQNVLQSISQWQGSNRISFNLPLVFLATKTTDDVLAPILALNRFGLANFDPGANTLFTYAPRRFAGSATEAVGAMGFKYGKWFQTPRVFVVRSYTPILSKLSMMGSDGRERPLMAAAQLGIEAYRIISGKEFNEWFISEPGKMGAAGDSSFYTSNGYNSITSPY